MDHASDAIAFFQSGWSCTQAMLAAHCEPYGVARDEAMRAAATVSAGPRPEDMCGAVTGALMVIGLARGGATMRHAAGSPEVRELARRFKERFQQTHGAVFCCELHGRAEESGDARAESQAVSEARCAALLRSASEILDDLLGS